MSDEILFVSNRGARLFSTHYRHSAGCYSMRMSQHPEQPSQAAKDRWQSDSYAAVYRFSVSLRQLRDTNPWPQDHPALQNAINTLATELSDRCFSVTEIRTAFEKAAADLPRYAAGHEVRP